MKFRVVGVVTASALAVLVGGCGATGTQSASQPAAPISSPAVSTTSPAAPGHHRARVAVRIPTLESFSGSILSGQRPRGWTEEASEQSIGGRIESRWRDPANASSALLIDVVLGDSSSAAVKASQVRQASQGTETLSFGPTLISGRQGWKWIFRTGGTERVDYFFSDCGATIAVLGSTTPARFASLAPVFSTVVESVQCATSSTPTTPAAPQAQPSPSTPSSGCGQPNNNSPPCDPANPPPDFCDSHDCIPNFPNGNGTVVQCNDGTWSQSGGIQGACSSHGGES